jgi:NUMOD4 motif/HNH endonuclease
MTASESAPAARGGAAREEWRAVVGYEGWYEVSSLGNVRRIARSNGATPFRVLRPRPKKKGYLQVNLSVHGEKRNRHVHDLVAAAFIGPRPRGQQVNHKNHVKSDNSLRNLEYGTAAYNTMRAAQRGLMSRDVRGERNPAARLRVDDVRKMRALFRSGTPRRRLAEMFEVTWEQVNHIVKRRNWRHV